VLKLILPILLLENAGPELTIISQAIFSYDRCLPIKVETWDKVRNIRRNTNSADPFQLEIALNDVFIRKGKHNVSII